MRAAFGITHLEKESQLRPSLRLLQESLDPLLMSFLVLEQLCRAVCKHLDAPCHRLHKVELVGIELAQLIQQQLPLGVDDNCLAEDGRELLQRCLRWAALGGPVVPDPDLNLQWPGTLNVSVARA
jgi:hypothetical protein